MRKHHPIHRLAGVAAAAAVTAGAMLAASSPAHAAATTYVRINAGPSPQVNLALHVPSSANGAQVVLQPFNNATAGQWEIIPTGAIAGAIQVKNRYSHQCLSGQWPLYGDLVVQDVCNGSDLRQQWIRTQDPVLPVWHMLNVGNIKSLSAPNAGAGVVSAYPSGSDTKQMWQMW
jgi:hypothetical protein